MRYSHMIRPARMCNCWSTRPHVLSEDQLVGPIVVDFREHLVIIPCILPMNSCPHRCRFIFGCIRNRSCCSLFLEQILNCLLSVNLMTGKPDGEHFFCLLYRTCPHVKFHYLKQHNDMGPTQFPCRTHIVDEYWLALAHLMRCGSHMQKTWVCP